MQKSHHMLYDRRISVVYNSTQNHKGNKSQYCDWNKLTLKMKLKTEQCFQFIPGQAAMSSFCIVLILTGCYKRKRTGDSNHNSDSSRG